MKEQFIDYKTAILAKEKGFDESTLSHWEQGIDGYGWGLFGNEYLKNTELTPTYNHNELICGEFSAPTQSLLQKWLREIYKIEIDIKSTITGYQYSIWKRDYNDDEEINWIGDFKIYEEALEQGLIEALKIIK